MGKRKIKWTERAVRERNRILDYWYFRNKSIVYSKKLNVLFISTIDLIASQPEAGKIFHRELKICFVLVKSYRIYYLIHAEELIILSIWDTRRNPSEFKEIEDPN